MNLAPAFMERDVSSLNALVKKVGSKTMHIDVGDGSWIKARTLPPSKMKFLKGDVSVHLMVKSPSKYLEQLSFARTVIAQFEPLKDVGDFISSAKKRRFKVGLAIDVGTPVASIKPFLKSIDVVLVMTVKAGAQGRSFHSASLKKIPILKRAGVKVVVDGGVNTATLPKVVKARPDVIVVGSAIVWAKDPRKAYLSLRRML